MEKQTFDPNKNYSWDENTEVVLSGREFGYMRTFVNMVVNSPEAQRLMIGMECAGILQGILEQGVQDGWVKERFDENTVKSPKNETGIKNEENHD